MKKYIWLLIFLPICALATAPAEQVLLTKRNIEALGFKVEVDQISSKIHLTLYAPPNIGESWKLVATQSYPVIDGSSTFLSKVAIDNPGEQTEVYISYDLKKSDASVGVYYVCVVPGKSGCKRKGKERLYLIYSVNEYVN